MEWSKYQKDIFKHISTSTNNITVNAVAGSGKTSTIVESLKYIHPDKKTIFLAFNKSIVEELKTKVPNHVNVSTLHSFGLMALRRKYGGSLTIDQKKTMDYLFSVSGRWPETRDMEKSERYYYLLNIKQIISLMKLNMVSNFDDIDAIIDKYSINIMAEEKDRSFESFLALNKKTMVVDFDDMVYLPASREDVDIMKHDMVFVDECQDLNKAQQELVKKIIKPKVGRLISVGDPKQSIYGFAGADIESYNRIKSIQNTIELPLSVSYRCGKSIVEEAKKIVPHLEAFENSKEGEVVYNAKTSDVEDKDMVLCRNKKPLIELCLKFLGNNRKAYMLGKNDIGNSLILLIRRQKKYSIEALKKSLQLELRKIAGRKMQEYDISEKQAKMTISYQNMEDKIECINVILDQKDVRTPEDAVKKIEQIFDDTSKGIILSTIHKSKGLESENVYVLKYDLLPSKFAKTKEELDQEENLRYVLITRAKNKLAFIDYEPSEEINFNEYIEKQDESKNV